MKINPKLKNTFFQIAASLILLGAALNYFSPSIAKYIMSVGVAGFAAVIFTTPYPGKSIRGKRLFNIQILAVILMAVSCFLMFREISSWVVTLLIAAILTLYSAYILPIVYKKEQEEDKDK